MITRRYLISTAAVGIASNVFRVPTASAESIGKGARLIVGFPPGGSVDVVARLLADQIKGYAPSLIVDNRTGAGGRVAIEALKTAEADGSAFLLTPGDQLTLFPHVYSKLGYNPEQDFAPVTTVCNVQFLLAVGPMVPAAVTTLADFIAWCRANPTRASYGTPGAGTRPHFLAASLWRSAGIEVVHVPYKGGPAALQDVVAGQIPATLSVFSNAVPHVQSGGLRALATTAPRRSPMLPNVPTMREAGHPAAEAVEWFGILLPAKAPAEVVAALNSAIAQALQSEGMKAGLAKLSMDVAGSSPTELAQLIKSDLDRWSTIVKATGFRPVD